MDAVKLILYSVRVGRFSARDGSVDVVVSFNDGADKEITKSIVVKDANQDAQQLVEEICNIVKNVSNRFDGREVFGKDVKLYFEKRDEAIEKISTFLKSILQKVESVRNRKVSEGYMDLVREITSMKEDL